jgi:hypothetical protein
MAVSATGLWNALTTGNLIKYIRPCPFPLFHLVGILPNSRMGSLHMSSLKIGTQLSINSLVGPCAHLVPIYPLRPTLQPYLPHVSHCRWTLNTVHPARSKHINSRPGDAGLSSQTNWNSQLSRPCAADSHSNARMHHPVMPLQSQTASTTQNDGGLHWKIRDIVNLMASGL